LRNISCGGKIKIKKLKKLEKTCFKRVKSVFPAKKIINFEKSRTFHKKKKKKILKIFNLINFFLIYFIYIIF